MKGPWKLGEIKNIGIYLHPTFIIIPGFIIASYYLQRHGIFETLQAILFIILLFVIVLLHELGHALTARHFGIKTHDITLLPVGGVARIEQMPEDSVKELAIAFAGAQEYRILKVRHGGVSNKTF